MTEQHAPRAARSSRKCPLATLPHKVSSRSRRGLGRCQRSQFAWDTNRCWTVTYGERGRNPLGKRSRFFGGGSEWRRGAGDEKSHLRCSGAKSVGDSFGSTQVFNEEEREAGGKRSGSRSGKDGGQAFHSRLASRARTALCWVRSHACRLFTAMPVLTVLSQVDVMDDANWRSRTQAATPRLPLGPNVR